MASPSRTSQFSKVHKVLKKKYKPVTPDSDRSVLEHLIFSCCAENAHYNVAEESFAALVHSFFDFNEIRVSSLRELSEVMSGLPDPPAAANRVKRVLQSVFEGTYSFDLEGLSKLNLGPAAEKLSKIDGTTAFSVAYVVQVALGGHAIPVDLGVLRALQMVDLISKEDVESGAVPGLERAVAKSKGLEFASLLHQLGADFVANPFAPALREILTEIDPEAAKRLPKRRTKKQAEAAASRRRKRIADQRSAKRRAKRKRRDEAERSAMEVKAKQPAGRKKSAQGKKAAAKQKTTADAKKKPAATKKKSAGNKDAGETTESRADTGKKKSSSARISKRKPR